MLCAHLNDGATFAPLLVRKVGLIVGLTIVALDGNIRRFVRQLHYLGLTRSFLDCI